MFGKQVHLHGEQFLAGHQRNADRVEQREEDEQRHDYIEADQHPGADAAPPQRGQPHLAVQGLQFFFGIPAPLQAGSRGMEGGRKIHQYLTPFFSILNMMSVSAMMIRNKITDWAAALPNL